MMWNCCLARPIERVCTFGSQLGVKLGARNCHELGSILRFLPSNIRVCLNEEDPSLCCHRR